MITTTSLILLNRKELNDALIQECARVAKAGGSFSICNVWRDTNWYTEYVINWPTVAAIARETA